MALGIVIAGPHSRSVISLGFPDDDYLFYYLFCIIDCNSSIKDFPIILNWFLWGVPHIDKTGSFLILSRYHFSEKLVGSPASSHYDRWSLTVCISLPVCRC